MKRLLSLLIVLIGSIIIVGCTDEAAQKTGPGVKTTSSIAIGKDKTTRPAAHPSPVDDVLNPLAPVDSARIAPADKSAPGVNKNASNPETLTFYERLERLQRYALAGTEESPPKVRLAKENYELCLRALGLGHAGATNTGDAHEFLSLGEKYMPNARANEAEKPTLPQSKRAFFQRFERLQRFALTETYGSLDCILAQENYELCLRSMGVGKVYPGNQNSALAFEFLSLAEKRMEAAQKEHPTNKK